MKKCSRKDCNEISPYKIFDECIEHSHESFLKVMNEVHRQAFPEMNGLGEFTEIGISKYAKFLRRMADG